MNIIDICNTRMLMKILNLIYLVMLFFFHKYMFSSNVFVISIFKCRFFQIIQLYCLINNYLNYKHMKSRNKMNHHTLLHSGFIYVNHEDISLFVTCLCFTIHNKSPIKLHIIYFQIPIFFVLKL